MSSSLFGTVYAQDTIKGDSVCTTMYQYRLDNIMITDLLNTRAEQGEIIALHDREVISYQMEIMNRKKIEAVLNDTISYYKSSSESLDIKLKRTRKIGLATSIAVFLVGFLL